MTCWTCGEAGHIAALCPKDLNQNLYAVGQEEGEISEEAVDNEEELQAWCLLEEINRKEKQKLKKAAHVSLLSVEHSQGLTVQDK